MTDVKELGRMITEDPSLADALTGEERAAMYESGDMRINQEFAREFLAFQETVKAQGGLCSLCSAPLEGIGHNAAPFPGRCCEACSTNRVVPERAKRVEKGLDPRGLKRSKDELKLEDAKEEAEWLRLNPGLNPTVKYNLSELAGGELVKGPNWDKRDQLDLLKAQDLEQLVRVMLDPVDENPLTKQDGHLAEEVAGGVEDAWRHHGIPIPDDLLERVRSELDKAVSRGAARKLPNGGYVVNKPQLPPRAPDTGAGKSPAFTDKIRRDPETQIRLPGVKQLIEEFGPMNLGATIEKAMEQMAPDLLRKFYPRVYENVGRYHSPRQCAAYLASIVFETAGIGEHRAPNAYRMLLPALETMARRQMPLFFIAPDLLEAVLRTDFADDIDWTTLKMPFDQGIFMLPKGALVHPEDGEVAMIVWARYWKLTPYPAPFPDWKPTTIGNDAFVLLGLCIKNGMWYDSSFNADHRPTVRLRNLFFREPGERTPPAERRTTLDSNLTEADEEFLEKLGVIVFGTMLAMNAKPELLEKGKMLKRVVKAGQAPREFWSPNIIGPRYRLKREVPKIDRHGKFTADQRKRDQGGTHASPRLHWRRGHFRNQRYGVGLREVKQIWMEPMLIGAEGEEE